MNDFTCEQFKDLMFDYIDDELNTENKLKIEEHLRDCSECVIEFQKTKNLFNAIKDSRYTADNRLYAALVPQLAAMKKRGILNKIRIYGSVAVAAVMVMVTIIYIMPMTKPEIISDNSLAYQYDMNETVQMAENKAVQITEMEIAAEEIMPEAGKIYAGGIMPSRVTLYSESANDTADDTMTKYLNTYAPDYADTTEVLYVSYNEVDLPENIVTSEIVDEAEYSVYVINRFTNIAFDVGEVTKYSDVYYGENDNGQYLIILKFKSG